MNDETPRVARRGRTRARGDRPRQSVRQPTATAIELTPDEPDPNDLPAFTWEPAMDPRPRANHPQKPAPEEPFWKRMGYKRDPNLAPFTGYAFSSCEELACVECYRSRSRAGYHPDLKGMGHSIPLLRFQSKPPQVSGSCKWCGVTIEGENGFLAWLHGEVS